MRPALIIIFAVLIAALLGFDAYEYDGHYREAAWEKTKHQANEIEHTVENWLGNSDHR
jgi:hypothetical protein